MYEICCLTALCTVARYKDVCLRHQFTKYLSHFRVCSTNHTADVAVCIAHAGFTPLNDFLCNKLVQWTAINKLILELAGRWIGCLHKYEDTLIVLLAYIHKWLHTIGSKIWIDCHEILIESSIFFASYLHLAKMSDCICR